MSCSSFARFGAPVAIVAVAVGVASCGGGGSSVSSIPQAAPSAAASTSGATTSFTVPAAGGTQALATVGGQTATIDFGAGATAGTTVTATSAVSAPANAPVPAAKARRIQQISGAVPFYFVTITVSQSLPGSVFTSESVTLGASDPTTASYYAEFDDITAAPATKIVSFGPGTVTGGIVTVENTGSGTASATSLVTGHTYLMQFYYVPASAASPSPGASPSAAASVAPTASPSAAASVAPTASPSAAASVAPTASPSAAASATPTSSPSASPSPSSSGNQSLPDYGFTGPSATTGSFTPPTEPAALVVPPAGTGSYGTYGVSATVQFDAAGGYGSNPASTTSNITMTLGSTSADITSSAFPYYSGSAHPLFYAELKNTGVAHFNDFPNVVITALASSLPSTSCSFFVYANNGNLTPTWNVIAGPVTASAFTALATITFPAQTLSNGTVDITNASPNYIMVGC